MSRQTIRRGAAGPARRHADLGLGRLRARRPRCPDPHRLGALHRRRLLRLGRHDGGRLAARPRRLGRARCSRRRDLARAAPEGTSMIRLGRISYVNMAPVFYGLEADIEEVVGVPTELNRMLLDGELDIAPIPSIEYARNHDRLRILPRLCVSSEGAIDSIQLVTRLPFGQVRSVAVTPESATSVVLVRILLPKAEILPLGMDADATLLIGDAALRSAFEDPDAALRPRAPLARADGAAHGLRGLGRARAARGRAQRPRARTGRLRTARALASPSASRSSRARRTATRRGSWPATSRSSATASVLANARVSSPSSRWPGMPASSRTSPSSASCARRSPRDQRSDDGRVHSLAHVRARDLSRRRSTGSGSRTRRRSCCFARATSSRSAASRTRSATALNDPTKVTFIVDRNLNYTNVCVTDCDFCAFYRRPGDQRESYLLPKPVIYKKIEETLAIGGTGAPHAGRPSPGPRDRLLRGSLPLDQGALQDPSARALPARDPAHRETFQAHRSPRRSRACGTQGSTPFPAAGPRSSSTGSAPSSPRRRRSRTSGSTSCARRTGSACRRRRR